MSSSYAIGQAEQEAIRRKNEHQKKTTDKRERTVGNEQLFQATLAIARSSKTDPASYVADLLEFARLAGPELGVQLESFIASATGQPVTVAFARMIQLALIAAARNKQLHDNQAQLREAYFAFWNVVEGCELSIDGLEYAIADVLAKVGLNRAAENVRSFFGFHAPRLSPAANDIKKGVSDTIAATPKTVGDKDQLSLGPFQEHDALHALGRCLADLELKLESDCEVGSVWEQTRKCREFAGLLTDPDLRKRILSVTISVEKLAGRHSLAHARHRMELATLSSDCEADLQIKFEGKQRQNDFAELALADILRIVQVAPSSAKKARVSPTEQAVRYILVAARDHKKQITFAEFLEWTNSETGRAWLESEITAAADNDKVRNEIRKLIDDDLSSGDIGKLIGATGRYRAWVNANPKSIGSDQIRW